MTHITEQNSILDINNDYFKDNLKLFIWGMIGVLIENKEMAEHKNSHFLKPAYTDTHITEVELINNFQFKVEFELVGKETLLINWNAFNYFIANLSMD